MKNLLLYVFLVLATVSLLQSVEAREKVSIAHLGSALGLNFGGDFAFGDAYTSRDPRFQFGLDYNQTFFAAPILFSFGQEIFILGFKPRLRVPVDIGAAPGLSIITGVGPVLNYWNGGDEALGYTIDVDVVELGAQVGFEVRYDFEDMPLYFSLTPLAIDMNFWRYVWVDTNFAGSESESNSDFGMVYNLLLGMGFRF